MVQQEVVDELRARVEQLSQDAELLAIMTESVSTNDNETPTNNSGWGFVKKMFGIS